MSLARWRLPTGPRRRLLVAVVAICFAGVVWQSPFARGQADRSGELQQLVNDLHYQISVLNRFDRRAGEERMQQLRHAIVAWNQAEGGDDDFRVMQEWLQEALRASLPGPSQTMPDPPVFAARPPRPEAPRVVQRQPPRETFAPPPVQAPEPVLDSESGSVVQRDAAEEPPATASEDAPPPTSDEAAEGLPIGDPLVTAPRATPPKSIAAPHPERDVWQDHPAAQPVDLGNPFRDDPPSGEVQVAMRPAGLTSEAAVPDVRINIAELGARVRGYVHGLRGVEAKLVAKPKMTPEELLLTTRELQQLAQQHEFVSLYLESLTTDELRQVPELPGHNRAKALVEQRLTELKRSPPANDLFDQVFADTPDPAVEKIEELLRGI